MRPALRLGPPTRSKFIVQHEQLSRVTHDLREGSHCSSDRHSVAALCCQRSAIEKRLPQVTGSRSGCSPCMLKSSMRASHALPRAAMGQAILRVDWDALRAGQMPEVYRDKRGTHYMVTQGGNKVGVTVDRRGRAYFIDKAGDLFYDSGDPKVGFYVVRRLPAQHGAAQACIRFRGGSRASHAGEQAGPPRQC